MNPKAYKIIMSRGDSIQADEDELQKIIEAIQKGMPCVLQQGLFNPSFYVSIIQDEERLKEHWHLINDMELANRRMGARMTPFDLEQGLKPLKDIFEGTVLRLQSKQPKELK